MVVKVLLFMNQGCIIVSSVVDVVLYAFCEELGMAW